MPPKNLRFGLFEADLSAAELRKRGHKIKLQDQPFRVLSLLLQHPGQVVTREDFQRHLWPSDTFVEFDEGLNKAIQKLRQALGDSSGNPRFIETLPRKGYRFIAPVESQPETVIRQTEKPANPVESMVTAPLKRHKTEVLAWTLFGIVSLVLLIVAAVQFRLLRTKSEPPLRAIPLTTYPGQQIRPALSPDGKQVAFAWDGEQHEPFGIYVKMLDSGAPLRLTHATASESWPAWSPDGRHIAFCRNADNGFEIRIIPALGGAERKLTTCAECTGLSWSPDGRFLASVDKHAPQALGSIFLVSVESGEKREITSLPKDNLAGDDAPHFSPDGKNLAFCRVSGSCEIYVLPLTDDAKPAGEPRPLVSDEAGVAGFDWTADGRRIIYSIFESADGLRSIPVSGGKPERLTIAADQDVVGLSISRAGKHLVYEQSVYDSNIWHIPSPPADPNTAPIRLIASTQMDEEPQISPVGDRIAFTSTFGKCRDLDLRSERPQPGATHLPRRPGSG